jgi:hypothetical protein
VQGAAIRFGVAMCCLTILRYLTDYLPDLPLCVMVSPSTSTDHSHFFPEESLQ